jgi:hypothetical protein
LIHKTYELYCIYYQYNLLIPKKDRYTIGVKIERSIIDLIELLFEAQVKNPDIRLTILEKADVRLKSIKLFVRLAHEVASLEQHKYLRLEEKVIEIGKMLGGWIKYTKNKNRR